MFARVATFEGIDIDAAERTMDELTRRVEPLTSDLAGSRGGLELVDRAGGKAVLIWFFDSQDDLDAAEPVFDQEMPKQLGDLFEQWAGRRTAVEQYEVVFDTTAVGSAA